MSLESHSSDIPPTSEIPLLAGRYQLLDKLGEGGMGVVFHARDTALDRFVAVKILPAGKLQDADAVARFRREALALTQLSHPHIIPAQDSGQDGDKHFLVMAWIEGHSLSAELAAKGPLPPTRAADYVRQAALGLHYAHRLGLVHRDVKPSNLLLGVDGRVYLLDLGLARFLQDQMGGEVLTQTGVGMGTPDYCAPEQFRDAHKADARSDIYSLGCTLYHLIAGQPPFPGSSLSEKVKAHETREPPPLAESCPEIPGGLTLVVARMLAKRPADRFSDMAEVAQALVPYVAGASPSFRALRETLSWTGNPLTTKTMMLRRRAVPWLITAASMLLALGAFIALAYTLKWHLPSAIVQSNSSPQRDTADKREPSAAANEEPKTVAAAHDPDILIVTKDAKRGGRFRSLREAVDAVDHPNMTIRVLDDAEYVESVTVQGPARAGLTVEAPAHATLVQNTPNSYCVAIDDVPRVTIRGFRLRVDKPFAGIGIGGTSAGAVVEDLEITSPTGQATAGISVEQLALETGDAPLLIQDCSIRDCGNGIAVIGLHVQSRQAHPSNRIVIRRNRIRDVTAGIWLMGQLRDIHIVGNRLSNFGRVGIRLTDLRKESDTILIANNSIAGPKDGISFQSPIAAAANVQVRNNLLLIDQAPDISGANLPAGLTSWKIDHNARSVFANARAAASSAFPLRHGLTAHELGALGQRSKSGDFPRPSKDSPLASEGAGKEDPSLPLYLGAVPPEDITPWDWGRTWQMPKNAQLLTVSHDQKNGGKYRTINEALKAARPWATIRILDDAEYPEHLSLRDKAKFEGLVVEAPKHATLVKDIRDPHAIEIRNIPHVCITGFRFRNVRFRDELQKRITAPHSFVFATGDVAGMKLVNLEIKSNSYATGIVFQQARSEGVPSIVKNCFIETLNDGIVVIGNPAIGACQNVRLSDNRVRSALSRGILLTGALERVQLTGNFVFGCNQTGIQIEDPAPSLRHVLLANNTICDCGDMGFRLLENETAKKHIGGQVELCNNLVFACRTVDLAYLIFSNDQGHEGDVRELLKVWHFRGNARDMFGSRPELQIPRVESDRLLVQSDLLSTDQQKPDRIRPAPTSPLATFGIKGGPGLPIYVGAQPPEGVEPWDWERTWRTRMRPIEK